RRGPLKDGHRKVGLPLLPDRNASPVNPLYGGRLSADHVSVAAANGHLFQPVFDAMSVVENLLAILGNDASAENTKPGAESAQFGFAPGNYEAAIAQSWFRRWFPGWSEVL